MNKIMLLTLLVSVPTMCAPEASLPQYDAKLTPQQKFETAAEMMYGSSRFQRDANDERPIVHLDLLRKRYFEEAANAGYGPAVAFRVRETYTRVCACSHEITQEAVNSLEHQVRDYVKDQKDLDECVKFLSQIRASNRVIRQ